MSVTRTLSNDGDYVEGAKLFVNLFVFKSLVPFYHAHASKSMLVVIIFIVL